MAKMRLKNSHTMANETENCDILNYSGVVDGSGTTEGSGIVEESGLIENSGIIEGSGELEEEWAEETELPEINVEGQQNGGNNHSNSDTSIYANGGGSIGGNDFSGGNVTNTDNGSTSTESNTSPSNNSNQGNESTNNYGTNNNHGASSTSQTNTYPQGTVHFSGHSDAYWINSNGGFTTYYRFKGNYTISGKNIHFYVELLPGYRQDMTYNGVILVYVNGVQTQTQYLHPLTGEYVLDPNNYPIGECSFELPSKGKVELYVKVSQLMSNEEGNAANNTRQIKVYPKQ